jgi:hypothetical protein
LESWLFILLCTAISIGALAFYQRSGAMLLYGDAVAHLNIARRVFDSRTPGLLQFGTVWLPLPHVLQIPFVVSAGLWRSGLGASIPSMLAYVVGALGVFRLVRSLASRTTAWIAALIYALNPNLIYLQATAMTEPLYLALFVWTVVFFSEFVREAKDAPQEARRSLERCAITLSAAMLVRYDAWFLAAALSAAVFVAIGKLRAFAGPVGRGAINFLLLNALVATLWLTYNRVAYANALEFANGPYSAHAIQQRSRTPSMPTYPGENSLPTAALYFLKLSRLNLGQGWAGTALLVTAIAAMLAAIGCARRFLPWILLWAPLIFYATSIAWGSVPIYFPDWWPFSYYNVRYGLQMLPAVAVFAALACQFLAKFLSPRGVALAAWALVAVSYGSVWWQTPICLREAQANGRARMDFDRQLAAGLKALPASATIMMDCGAHPGAVQDAGISFRRVLRESNPPYWEIALADPAPSADYVVAIQGDEVSRAVRRSPRGLEPVATIGADPGPKAVIYRSSRR